MKKLWNFNLIFRTHKILFAFIFFSSVSGCWGQDRKDNVQFEIVRYSSEFNDIVSEEAAVEVIGENFDWVEGPLWVEAHEMLLFSDIPRNTIFKWTEENGVEPYLEPSGYTQDRSSEGGKGGSNGLFLNPKGDALMLCQHGDRRMAIMQAPLDRPKPEFNTVAHQFQGKTLNSPNDGVSRDNGEIYFTDPPYGLEKGINDPNKDIPYQGVYKISTSGKVDLLVDTLTRPNGIAFFPGEKTLLIANSDPLKPFIYAYDVNKDGGLTEGRIFYDASTSSKIDQGMPDGLKIDRNGNVFATGPGGVWVLSRQGKVLGRIKINQLTSNCALANQDKTLFITADNYLLKVNLK